MPIDWQPLFDIIDQNHTFLITCHCRADCDALGSELALASILRTFGKQVRVVNGDQVPEHIAFLDPDGRILVLDDRFQGTDAVDGLDCVIVVDTSAWGQLGPMADVVRSFDGMKVVIDHHVSQDDLGAQVFKDSTAEATGRLILELAEAAQVPITPEIAIPLFAAIATDTGWFRFSSVTEATFQSLARLVAAGASPPLIFSALYEQHSLVRLHLRGRMLERIQADPSGRLLWTEVTEEDFQVTKAKKTDTEEVINLLHTVASCEVAVMFAELEENKTKVSLRSRSDFDVREIASRFGGGGHTAASGITYNGPLAQARTEVLDAVLEALDPEPAR